MKVLKNHTLLYDDQCPLCVAYTGTFVKQGMLDGNGRTKFEEADRVTTTQLDRERAKDEIALLNTTTGKVIYGLDSLLEVIGHNFPKLAAIARFRPVYSFLTLLYKFISYNRKVIAPSRTYLQQACKPHLYAGYRIAYMLFAAVITSTVLYNYSFLLSGALPASNVWREFAICFGQIVFQGVLLFAMRAKKQLLFDYLGNMMTVSLIGALLLIPMWVFAAFVHLPLLAPLGYFMMVVAVMLFLHTRRVAWISAPAWLSLSWIGYRCLVLAFIL